MATFTTNPIALKELMESVKSGKIQLPDFQRGWVWDDYRIRALIASISRGFPVGAIMTLRAGGKINFKTRLVEGVNSNAKNEIDQFLLDGQQRLTSLYKHSNLLAQCPRRTAEARKSNAGTIWTCARR